MKTYIMTSTAVDRAQKVHISVVNWNEILSLISCHSIHFRLNQLDEEFDAEEIIKVPIVQEGKLFYSGQLIKFPIHIFRILFHSFREI